MNRLFVVLLFASSVAHAEPLQLQAGRNAESVAEHLYYFIESEGEVDPNQLLGLEHQFIANTKSVFNLGLVNAPVWIRLDLENTGRDAGEWVLSLNFSSFDSLTAYQVHHDTLPVEIFSFADAVQRSASYLRYRTTAFPVTLQAEAKTRIYIRFLAPNTSMPITLMPEAAHTRFIEQKIFLYTAIFAGLIAMLLFTSVPLIQSGLHGFAIYPVGQLFLFAFCFHMDGLTTVLVWPENPEYGRMFASQSGTAYYMVMLAFARSFLDLKERSWLLDRLFIGFIVIGGVLLVYSISQLDVEELDRRFTTLPAILVGLMVWLILPILGIYATLKWDKDYWPIAIAWILIPGVVLGVVMVVTGGISEPPFGRYYYAVVVAAEALCLWGALMLRVRRVMSANVDMQQTLSDQLEQQVSLTQQSQNLAQQKSVALQEASDKGHLLLAAGHDARQAISALRSFAYGLKRAPQDANQLSEEIDQLAVYLDETLESAMEGSYSGGVNDSIVAVERFDPEQMFTTLKLVHQSDAFAKRLDLRTVHYGGAILSDRVLVMRIVSNLISNAIKYTEQGGVLVAFRERSDGDVIQIWDTGPGIEKEKQEVLFDPEVFQKRFQSDQAPGIGAGLSISLLFARRIGAELSVRSRVGKGSMFQLKLPVVRKPTLPITAFIEDDTDLSDMGVKVNVLRNGVGLSSLTDDSIVLIDQDYLEAGHGLEIAQSVQSQFSSARILLATYDHSLENRERISTSCHAVLYKPFDARTLAVAANLVQGG